MHWIIVALFFCSGATALVYEVVWAKYLSLIFGSTVQAQSVVLAVFMGGLALGNRLFGGRADTLKHPLAVYGVIEIAIGAYALAFHLLYGFADGIFVALGGRWLENPALLLSLKGLLSAALLLGPTILMGGTLPVMAAWLQKRAAEAGRRSALFYAINSIGAVAGAGLAGFFLVRTFGLVVTLAITAVVNLVIGGVAIFLSGRQPAQAGLRAKEQAMAAAVPVPKLSAKGRTVVWAGGMVFLTGMISLALEVVASRALSLVFGASLQAFATMLMAFILGIGIGSAMMASRRASRFINEGTAVFLLLGAAVWVALFVLTVEQWTVLYVKLRNELGQGGTRYVYHQLLSASISIVVLGIPAALIGAILPLWIRILSASASLLGRQVGVLLTWNTLGAVLGAVLAGFVMMPLLGLRGSLGLLAVLLSAVAMVAAWRSRARAAMFVSVSVAFLALVIWLTTGPQWQRAMTAGVFRFREDTIAWDLTRKESQHYEVLFYEDATDATVSVEVPPGQRDSGERILRINGKPDASTHRDLSTQYLLAHLPMLARPESRDVFVLGFGSGITGGALLGHPVNQVVIAENCRPVLRAAPLFEPWNRAVHKDARVRIIAEDARTILKLSSQQFDVIISEPSNPWVAGIGSVFTREFYELAASRLRDEGIMAQWLHMYEMEDELVLLMLRTFQSVFPHLEIWEPGPGDIILLGSKQPWESSPEIFRRVYALAEPRRDLSAIGLRTPESVWARQIASQQTAFAIAGEGPVQSDLLPVLEYAASKAFYTGSGALRLYAFDERTWQSAVAPEEKRRVLRSLHSSALDAVFSRFHSDNGSLMRYVEWRVKVARQPSSVYTEQPYLPIIFRPAESYPEKPPEVPNLTPLVTRLYEAEALAVGNPLRWREGVEVIEAVLEDRGLPGLLAADLAWLPGYFGSVAARMRFLNHDHEGARAAVAAGLRIAPRDIQLLYLERLFQRLRPETESLARQ